MTEHNDLLIIRHTINNTIISLRAIDGYVNATALCNAGDTQLNLYLENETTKEFIKKLGWSVGIPIDLLIQIISDGKPEQNGTWVHPQVAINLAHQMPHEFKISITQWVIEWVSGTQTKEYIIPYRIRRYLINKDSMIPTHFSLLDYMTIRFFKTLEYNGYLITQKIMPEISMGKMFFKWLIDNGYNPDTFPTYVHLFDDGVRTAVKTILYPHKITKKFNKELDRWIIEDSIEYFSNLDKNSKTFVQKTVERYIENKQKRIQAESKVLYIFD